MGGININIADAVATAASNLWNKIKEPLVRVMAIGGSVAGLAALNAMGIDIWSDDPVAVKAREVIEEQRKKEKEAAEKNPVVDNAQKMMEDATSDATDAAEELEEQITSPKEQVADDTPAEPKEEVKPTTSSAELKEITDQLGDSPSVYGYLEQLVGDRAVGDGTNPLLNAIPWLSEWLERPGNKEKMAAVLRQHGGMTGQIDNMDISPDEQGESNTPQEEIAEAVAATEQAEETDSAEDKAQAAEEVNEAEQAASGTTPNVPAIKKQRKDKSVRVKMSPEGQRMRSKLIEELNDTMRKLSGKQARAGAFGAVFNVLGNIMATDPMTGRQVGPSMLGVLGENIQRGTAMAIARKVGEAARHYAAGEEEALAEDVKYLGMLGLPPNAIGKYIGEVYRASGGRVHRVNRTLEQTMNPSATAIRNDYGN